MLKQVKDKDTLLALLKADTPVANIVVDENGELSGGDFNALFNDMLTDPKSIFVADIKEPEKTVETVSEDPEPETAVEPASSLGGFKPVAVEKNKGGAKPIDKGKVKALFNAGWTEHSIDDEMGISQNRIHASIQKMKERGEL